MGAIFVVSIEFVTVLLLFYGFFFFFYHEACGISAVLLEMEPAFPALKSEVPTTRPPG